MDDLSWSLKRGSSEFRVIKNKFTYPRVLRSTTIFAISSESLPNESPKPGVSRIINLSAFGSFLNLLATPFT